MLVRRDEHRLEVERAEAVEQVAPPLLVLLAAAPGVPPC